MTWVRTILLSACVALAGCAHNVSSDYANYLESNQGENRFPRTNVNARYYIAPQVRGHSYQIRSVMAGAANTWNVHFGQMLAGTLESADYQAAFTSLTETKDADAAAGLVFKYQRVNYAFTNTQAQIGLTIAVYRNGERVFIETYSQKGISQGGKMFWAGALGMANAVQQSTKSALDKILTDSLSDFQVAMKKPIEAPQTALVTSASAVAVGGASATGSTQKQTSKATTGRKQHATADGHAVAETLAALTLLHDQGVLSDKDYMQKQREIINEHTRKTQASLAGDGPLTTSGSGSPQEGSPSGAAAVATVTALGVTSEKEVSESIPPIAVAVFPFARSGMVVTNDADHLLPEFAHRYVSENRQLRLSESYFKQDGSTIRGKSHYWSTSNRPLDSQIYSDGARIGADVILMYSYSGRYGSEDRFDVTVYLFDVKNRHAYQANGNQGNYKRVTESLFREITETTSLRVAILPFASAPAWFSSAETELIEFSQDFFKGKKDLELAYSYYSSQLDSKVINDPGSYWSGGYGAQKPIESNIYAVRNKLNVDVVLMYYHSPRTADPYASELYKADVYVFDLKKKRLYHESGDERSYSALTEQLFAQLIREREGSAGTNSPSRLTGSTVVAAGLATQATTTVPVSTPSESLPKTVMVPAQTQTQPAQSQPQLLTPEEVRELLTGNTFTGESDVGNGFHVFYKVDGTMYGLLFKGPWKGKRDDGTWVVTSEKGHCRQWSQWAQQEKQCFKIYRDGERLKYEQTSAYKVRKGSGYMRKGNPENL